MQKQINFDLKILYKWLLANMISLNSDKTEIIIFRSTREKRPELKIKMDGLRLYPSTHIKYLGVYIDETLNFNIHCNMLAQKLRRANGILSKARHYMSMQTV